MKSSSANGLRSLRAFALGLPLLVLAAGCYSDPNISSQNRYRFADEDTTPTGAAGAPVFPGDVAARPGVAVTVPPSSATPAAPPASATPAPPPAALDGGKIAIGDALTIYFPDTPEGALPRQLIIKVGPEGTITLPYNVTLRAVSKTPTELERDIRAAYVPSLFVTCTPTVKAEERYFFVGGEVKIASRQAYTSHTMTVLRAITTAGGFTDFAKKTKIEVRRANGGKTEYINYNKALKDPKLDLPVYPGDEIIVPRGL